MTENLTSPPATEAARPHPQGRVSIASLQCWRCRSKLIRAGKLELPLPSVSGRAAFGMAQARFFEAFAGNVVKHVIIEDAGHFVVEEQPEAVTAELLSFFRS